MHGEYRDLIKNRTWVLVAPRTGSMWCALSDFTNTNLMLMVPLAGIKHDLLLMIKTNS